MQRPGKKGGNPLPKWHIECKHCHAIIEPVSKPAKASTFFIALILLCFFVVPGIIYLIWDSSRRVCPNCLNVIK